ncbi:hypothetical protein N5K21_22350 [Rhizobium pusense]|uniref:Uncharacterized protein n=1 Tax=Agrobacterium pusense TaxID=648995 RepID=A0A6H0ZP77_9HYPH|nr:hypothetical protein [Agrobacterium pusense]MDH2091476.1 hypothetical protein [Agrobacterium pusense]QIX22616.1 hypothetical protein FOB41_16445 [Agrobacterium pusense]WCK24527.1 hypothetical protein CFBP5496_0002745 [Agrobacterium pusense]
MSAITWKSVRWRGGDGYSGFIDGDMTVMIFPTMPDHGLSTPFGMKFFSRLYDTDACDTGRHIAIPLDSLEHGQQRAEEIWQECLKKAGVA